MSYRQKPGHCAHEIPDGYCNTCWPGSGRWPAVQDPIHAERVQPTKVPGPGASVTLRSYARSGLAVTQPRKRALVMGPG